LPKRNSSRDNNPQLKKHGGTAGPREIVRGIESTTRITRWRRAEPEKSPQGADTHVKCLAWKDLKGLIQRFRIEGKTLRKNVPCAQIIEGGRKFQRIFAAKETVNPGGTYLEKMATQIRFLFLVERN
jgi:hypothetical protein